MVPVASTTLLVTTLFTAFWQVLSGPGIYVMGGLIGVAIIFWAYRSLAGKFGGGRR